MRSSNRTRQPRVTSGSVSCRGKSARCGAKLRAGYAVCYRFRKLRARICPRSRAQNGGSRRAGDGLECAIALLLGEGEAGLGVTALGGVVADQESDGGVRKARRPACGQCPRNQCLHQPAAARRRPRCDMLDQPIRFAALDPAAAGIISAREDIGEIAARCRMRTPPLRARNAWCRASRATASRTARLPARLRLRRSGIARRDTRIAASQPRALR